MTRRERLERRAERLRGWAAKREERAAAVFKAGEPFRGDIAFNTQPGHIPERARINAREHRAFESMRKAEGMEGRAAGIERALNASVYGDDPDAIERLEARIAEREAEAALRLAVNRAWRAAKGGSAAFLAALKEISPDGHQKIAEHVARTMGLCPWLRQPLDTTNLRAAIRGDRERLDRIRQERAKAIEQEGQP